MPAYNGTSGTFTFGSTTLVVTTWSCSVEQAMLPVTNKNSAGYEEFIPGLKKVTGSADCLYEGTPVVPGASGNYDFQLPDGTDFISGTAYIDKVDYDSPIDNVVTMKLNVTGTGAFAVGASS